MAGEQQAAQPAVHSVGCHDQVGVQGAFPDRHSHPAGLVASVELRLAGEGRQRSLARYTCAIESVHHPELREILVPRENAARQVVHDFLAARGFADARTRTVTLLTCIDGLVFDRLVNGGNVSDSEIRGLVAAALR